MWNEICAQPAMNSAPPSTSSASISSFGRGKTASRRVMALGFIRFSSVAKGEHVLPGVDRILVLDEKAVDDAVLVGLDLVVGLHHLDEADHVAARDRVAL